MLPDWLLSNEEYVATPDRDAFIDRSIRSFLGILSRFRRQGVNEEKLRINPAVRLGSTLLLIVLLSLARDFLFISYMGALLIVTLSLFPAQLILRILKRSLPIGIFTFLLMLPSALWGNTPSLVMITLKVFFSIVAVNLFISTVRWESILSGLRIFMPRFFILILDITTRYLVLLGELSLHMLWALKLRSVGRNPTKTASLAGVAGSLFLRSREMAEDTYAAMQCRCFTGSYPLGSTARLSAADLLPVAFDVASVLMFVWTRTR